MNQNGMTKVDTGTVKALENPRKTSHANCRLSGIYVRSWTDHILFKTSIEENIKLGGVEAAEQH